MPCLLSSQISVVRLHVKLFHALFYDTLNDDDDEIRQFSRIYTFSLSYLAIDFHLLLSMTRVYFTPAKYAQFDSRTQTKTEYVNTITAEENHMLHVVRCNTHIQ